MITISESSSPTALLIHDNQLLTSGLTGHNANHDPSFSSTCVHCFRDLMKQITNLLRSAHIWWVNIVPELGVDASGWSALNPELCSLLSAWFNRFFFYLQDSKAVCAEASVTSHRINHCGLKRLHSECEVTVCPVVEQSRGGAWLRWIQYPLPRCVPFICPRCLLTVVIPLQYCR